MLYPKMTRLLRELKPAIVHTRNLAALEMAVPAWWAGCRCASTASTGAREDLAVEPPVRLGPAAYRPFVTHYVALSHELERYLVERVAVPQTQVSTRSATASTRSASARRAVREAIPVVRSRGSGHWLVGTVGRMQPVKDQVCLVQAFVRAIEIDPASARLAAPGSGG